MDEIEKNYTTIFNSNIFDEEWYLNEYPDAKSFNLNPIVHYLMIGARLFRNPNPNFNTEAYCKQFSDSIWIKKNPLIHYIESGAGDLSFPSSLYRHGSLPENDLMSEGRAFLHRSPKASPKVPNNVLAKTLAAEFSVHRISVVTVCLNCHDTIGLTLENIRQQTYHNVEHVLIDGGSTDGTAEIIENFGVDYFVSEPDRGIYDAMEKGVRAATGDAIIFLNSGDIFHDKHVCEDLVAYFNRSGTSVIFGDFYPYLINPGNIFDHSFRPGKLERNFAIKNRNHLAHRNIHHQAVIYRREIFEKCGFFCPEIPNGSDYYLTASALVGEGFSAKYFPRIISKFALGGISTSNYEAELRNCDDLRKLIVAKFFSGPPVDYGDEYAPLNSESILPKPTVQDQSDRLEIKVRMEAELTKYAKIGASLPIVALLVTYSAILRLFWSAGRVIYRPIELIFTKIGASIAASVPSHVPSEEIRHLSTLLVRQHAYHEEAFGQARAKTSICRKIAAQQYGSGVIAMLGLRPGQAIAPDELAEAIRALKKIGLVSAEWYLRRYTDVAEAGLDPIAHYIVYGAIEGREPNEVFAAAFDAIVTN